MSPRLRRRLRAAALAAVGVLYVLSIPWYRRGGEAPDLGAGLPGWVVVAIACYAGAAVLNAIAWLLTDVPDTLEPGDDEPPA